MPRQIDLFPQNLQVNNDPTNRLGVTAAQVNHLNDQIPAALARAQSLAITNFLTLLDQETGLDLLGLWHDFQTSQTAVSAALQQSWMNIQNGASWSIRLTNDLLITSDVFHLVYNAGTSTDPPGTLGVGGVGNGKPTWYSAWNDLLSLAGVVNSVAAPTDPAPTTGTVIQANTAAATTAGTNASIAIANASAVATTAQEITDGIYQSQNGGTSTGNPTSSIVPSLTAIPASNIVGQTGAAVTYGATGGGNASSAVVQPKTITESHTIAAGDGTVYTCLAYCANAVSTWTSAVTYGGTAMTLVVRQASSSFSGNQLFAEVWKLKTPPSGTQTVSGTVSRVTGAGSVVWAGIGSVSYSSSKEPSTAGNTGGSTTNPTMSQSSAAGRMVLGFFAVLAGSAPTLSSFSQTQRTNLSPTGGCSLVIGDAAGASSVSFGVTSSTSVGAWCGITVDMSN